MKALFQKGLKVAQAFNSSKTGINTKETTLKVSFMVVGAMNGAMGLSMKGSLKMGEETVRGYGSRQETLVTAMKASTKMI